MNPVPLPDGTQDVHAVLVALEFGPIVARSIPPPLVGIEVVVPMEPEDVSVELVAPAFGDDAHDPVADSPVLGVVRIARDLHLLNGIHRWRSEVGAPVAGTALVGNAIDRDRVAGLAAAVHREQRHFLIVESILDSSASRVLERGHHTGVRVNEEERIAEVQRQLGDLFAIEVARLIGGLRVE